MNNYSHFLQMIHSLTGNIA